MEQPHADLQVSPAPSSTAVSRLTILVALTASEMRRFFPGGLHLNGLGARTIFEDPNGFTEGSWLEYLDLQRPHIIVSCWCTKSLAGLLNRPGSQLRYVCHIGGSVRGIVSRELVEQGLVVTNWGGVAAPDVAEQALLLILGTLRNAAEWPSVFKGERDKWSLNLRSLFGLRVGIHGFGRIARAFVHLVKPWAVTMKAYSGGVPSNHMEEMGVAPCSSLEELFCDVDVLLECEALTGLTSRTVTEDLLCRLGRGTVFVNVGRGAVVDEAALRELAASGHLRVGLDVHEGEYWPPDSEWWKIRNALHSPHIGGPTDPGCAECGRLAIENLRRFAAGEPLENIVDLQVYDRST